MAISGKRFQITDGASAPTNLFPYTVTEAVYGLSTVIANAISTFQQTLGSMAYETATNYLPLTGGMLAAAKTDILNLKRTNAGNPYVGFYKEETAAGFLGVKGVGIPSFLYNGVENTIYHSGNSNKSDVAWSASSLTLSNAYSLKWKNSGGTVINEMAVASDNNLYIGEGQKSTASTFIYGNDIRLCYGSGSLGVILNSSGNVGIGTSPGYKLDVNGDIRLANNNSLKINTAGSTALNVVWLNSSNDLLFGYDVAANSLNTYINGNNIIFHTSNSMAERMRIDSSGNVGIGTPWPYSKVEIAASSYAEPNSTSVAGSAMLALDAHNNDGIYFGFGSTTKGWIQSAYYGTSTTTSATHTYQLCLNPLGGNVGIGTNNPLSKLTVNSSAAGIVKLKRTVGSNAGAYIDYYGENQDTNYWRVGGLVSSSAGSFSFIKSLGGTETNLMTIAYNGNVGIGTPSPAFSLDVNGPIRSLGVFYFMNTDYTANAGYIGRGSSVNNTIYIRSNLSADIVLYTGSATATFTSAGTWTTTGDQVISSDAALKKNWREVGYGIEEIANCTVGRFDWKDGHGTSVGSKAQDWLPLVPELVHGEEGNMTLAYGQIALVNSILLAKHETEQDKEIARLKARVKELETRLNIS